MENLTGGTPPVRYLPCVVPCKLYFATGEIKQLTTYHDKIEGYVHAQSGISKLFAVWPGHWRSDLFIIDDLEAFRIGQRLIRV